MPTFCAFLGGLAKGSNSSDAVCHVLSCTAMHCDASRRRGDRMCLNTNLRSCAKATTLIEPEAHRPHNTKTVLNGTVFDLQARPGQG